MQLRSSPAALRTLVDCLDCTSECNKIVPGNFESAMMDAFLPNTHTFSITFAFSLPPYLSTFYMLLPLRSLFYYLSLSLIILCRFERRTYYEDQFREGFGPPNNIVSVQDTAVGEPVHPSSHFCRLLKDAAQLVIATGVLKSLSQVGAVKSQCL